MDLRRIAPAPVHPGVGMSAPQKFSQPATRFPIRHANTLIRRARVFLPAWRSSQLLRLSYGVCFDLGMIFTE
jgi:hypothetical protein